MTNKNSNWISNAFAIAAAVAAVAVPVSAQDVRLKAAIPFAFSVNKGANLAPGNYVVTHDQNVWLFSNADTRRTVAIVNYSGRQGRDAERPSLTFDCLGAHCQLREIHTGGIELGAEVAAPPLSNSDKAELRLVSVALQPINSK